jgi:hypothetical protein
VRSTVRRRAKRRHPDATIVLNLLQRSEWPPSAVHDTVAAIARGIEYRRSLRQSLLDRAFLWLARGVERLIDFIRHLPSSRTIGLTILGLIVAAIVARLVISALARDESNTRLRRSRGVGAPRIRSSRRSASRPRALRGCRARALPRRAARARAQRPAPPRPVEDERRLRARAARARLGSYQPFRDFSRRFDVAVFGHGGCDAALIDDLRRLAHAVRARARAA